MSIALTIFTNPLPLPKRGRRQKGGKPVIQVPTLAVNEVSSRRAYVFKLTGVE